MSIIAIKQILALEQTIEKSMEFKSRNNTISTTPYSYKSKRKNREQEKNNKSIV